MMITTSTKNKLNKANKTPSLRDLFLGKKVVKSLPENFFEKVLDLELRIKREFGMNLLQELINYYSTAIEYYESKEDPKFKDYQNRLNSLLAQPDILKKMSDMSKAKSTAVTHDYLKTIKKEQEKKSLATKVSIKNQVNNKINNDGKVQTIIKGIKDNEKIDHIVTKDMNAQEESFKKRLAERKNKKLLSTSDCTEAVETFKNQRTLTKNNNLSQILLPNNHNNNNTDDLDFNIKDLIEADANFDIDTSFDKEAQDPNTVKSYSKKLNSTVFINKTSNFISPNNSFIEARPLPKHKTFIGNVSVNVASFLSCYTSVFADLMRKYTEELNELYEEKYGKKFIINKNYHAQIAEMELMVKDDESHRESINIIIENLQEDMQGEFKKVEEEYRVLIEEKERKFLDGMRGCNSLQVIEEKFKMEMLSSLNDVMLSKK